MFRKVAFHIVILIISLAAIATACGDYKKVLKSTDLQYKYERAIQYYGEEEYFKAYPLFEELLTVYRGTKRAEDVYYHLAYCDYFLKDYILASHRFKQFSNNFPYSSRAEECHFMSAYSHYLNSPKASLDQTDTEEALDAFQLFVDKFPDSQRIDSCNELMDQLRLKLENKSYEKASLYYRTRDYKAAIVTFGNLLNDFPDTKRREEVSFTILKSHFQLAQRSVEIKKKERVEDAMRIYVKFIDRYPESEHAKEAESIYNNLLREKEKLRNKNS